MSRDCIKVVCRLRPENKREIESGKGLCMTHTDDAVKIVSDKIPTEFTFDKIFGPSSQQRDVFEFAAKPIIDAVVDGYNGTLLCYGQTSSGKTFTMEGVKPDHPNYKELCGVIPRMMVRVFENIEKANDEIEFIVKCSYLEIYNEKVQDLLDPNKSNLLVKEDKDKGIYIQDLTEENVIDDEEMYQVFIRGSLNRSVASTDMNDKSSRSHSIFILSVFQRNIMTESTKTGKLYFVDLAGSEKQSKTKAEGTVLDEAKNINKSLMTLGMVINNLTEGKTHIPYRDSKLTRILQESLGGNSLTTLVIACSMSADNDKESLGTLRFGSRAKTIKNKPKVNKERTNKELIMKLKEAEERIKILELEMNKYEGIETLKKKIERNQDILNDFQPTSMTERQEIKIVNCEHCERIKANLLNMHIELNELDEQNSTLQEKLKITSDELTKITVEKDDMEEEVKVRNSEIYDLNNKIQNYEKLKYTNDEVLANIQIEIDSLLSNTNKDKQNLNNLSSKIINNSKNYASLMAKFKNSPYIDVINIIRKSFDNCSELVSKLESTNQQTFEKLKKSFGILTTRDEISTRHEEGSNPSSKIWKFPSNANSQFNLEKNRNSSLINLNVNRNISINIINQTNNNKILIGKDRKIHRRNSFSHFKTLKIDNLDEHSSHKRVKATTPSPISHEKDEKFFVYPATKKSNSIYGNTAFEKYNSNSINFKNPMKNDSKQQCHSRRNSRHNSLISANKSISVNEFYASSNHHSRDLDAEINNFNSYLNNDIYDPNEMNEDKEEILKHKETILELTENIYRLENEIQDLKLAIKEKDETMSLTEEILKQCEENMFKKSKQLEDDKSCFIKDLAHKEKQILDLYEKNNSLQELNFKLTHFNKDKKKFAAMEQQIKDLTISSKESNLYKKSMESKNEECKKYLEKIFGLESNLSSALKKVKNLEENYISAMNIIKRNNQVGQIQGNDLNLNQILNRPNIVFNKYYSDRNLINIDINQYHTKHNKNVMRVVKGGGQKKLNKKFHVDTSNLDNKLKGLMSPTKAVSPSPNMNLEHLRKEKYDKEMALLNEKDDDDIGRFDRLAPASPKKKLTIKNQKKSFFSFFSKN